MTIARLAGRLGLIVCFTACGRTPEPSAPSASATSASPTASAPEDDAKGELAELPAPAPAPGLPGVDRPNSKAAEDEAEFTNVEAAERALNQAKADLDRLALAEPAKNVGRSSTAKRDTEKKDAAPAERASSAGAAAPMRSSAVCEDACRALSSLARAAHAVCRLDGSSGAHCTRAKHVLADAQQRVASCSCASAND